MNRQRSKVAPILLAMTLAIVAVGPAVAASAPTRPNVVIIVADDLGYHDVGFQGCQDIPTPRIDALAKSGTRCTNGYVSGPYCSPTRAGLLTGRYQQQRFGHEFNPGGRGSGVEPGLPTTETTIADRFKSAGYATGLVGKWHLGDAPQYHPQKRGFDEFFGFLGGAHAYFPAKQAAPILRGTDVVEETAYLTDAFARESASFVERHKDQPFLLYVAFNAVHTPMHATDDRLARFASIKDETRRTYAAMTAALDEGVGTVVDALAKAGVAENTLVFFFSDNGGPTMAGTSINGAINTPLRGSKRTTTEGGIRVPFVVKWDGKVPADATYHKPVIQLDVLPTALAAAGIDMPDTAKLDGVNLIPYLSGAAEGVPHESLFWRLGKQSAIRRGDWKLVVYDAALDSRGRSGGEQGLKVSPPRLYNLAHDIGESEDLASKNPAKLAELAAAWRAWSEELAQPLWAPVDRGARAKKAGR